jgi:hypothetical protein
MKFAIFSSPINVKLFFPENSFRTKKSFFKRQKSLMISRKNWREREREREKKSFFFALKKCDDAKRQINRSDQKNRRSTGPIAGRLFYNSIMESRKGAASKKREGARLH